MTTITVTASGFALSGPLVAGEPVAVSVSGVEFADGARPCLTIRARFPNALLASADLAAEAYGDWTFVDGLLAACRAINPDFPTPNHLEIDAESVWLVADSTDARVEMLAVNTASGSSAVVVNGSPTLMEQWPVGSVVATRTTALWGGVLYTATKQTILAFLTARADEARPVALELLDAEHSESIARISASMLNSSLLPTDNPPDAHGTEYLGVPGPEGPEGPEGPAGKDGKDGADGKDGKDGTDGKDGQDGAPGAAATVSVGTVTTLSPGSAATVTNSGTSAAAVFNFGIPQGAKGDPQTPYASNPEMDGTASPGSSDSFARGDHVHPAPRYSFSSQTPTVSGTGATVACEDRAINDFTVATGVTSITITPPAAVANRARDFFCRVTLTDSSLPTVTLTGATIDIGATEITGMTQGVNLLMFTEIASGHWIASRRSAS